MLEELHPQSNKLNRLFEKFSRESKAVAIAMVSLVVSALSLLMAFMAVYDAIQAKIKVDVVFESNKILNMEVRLLQNKIEIYNAKFDSKLENK